MTRRVPVKPLVSMTRHSAAPLRLPPLHEVSSCVINGSSEFIRTRNTSTRPPRTTCHRPLHAGEEGGAGIFHQVPPISDLNGVRTARRSGLPVTGASIARDDADRRATDQPCRHRRGFPIWQNVEDAPPFRIANDRPVTVTALLGKVVDTNHARFLRCLNSTAPDDAQHGVIADGQEQTSCEACPGRPPSARPR